MKYRHFLNKKGLWTAWLAVIMMAFAIPVTATTYTYDDLGRLISASNGSSSRSYTYDAGGNVLSAVYGSTSLALISSDPLNQASNVSVGQSVYMQFSQSIEQGVNFSGISLMAGQNSISVADSVYGSELTIDPISDLDYSTAYTLTVPAGALNETSGSASNSEIAVQFTTAGSNLTMLSSNPVNNATGVPTGQTITVTFSQDIQAGDNYNNISLTAGGTPVSTSNSISGSVLTIDPTADLAGTTQYILTIPAGALKNMDNSALNTQMTIQFTTG